MSIPVFGVPVLARYDLLANLEASIDVAIDRYYVVDNGGSYTGPGPSSAVSKHVCNPGFNLGFGPSFNLMIRSNLRAPWWMFTNDDMVFAPGHLADVEQAMWDAVGIPQMVVVGSAGFSAFAVNDRAIETVGWFDESYYPAYCEDNDWTWRASKLRVEIISVPGESSHLGSQTIVDIDRRMANNRSFPKNVNYHISKWGGHPGGEVFSTPFNSGVAPDTTTAPKLSRLRDLAW